MDLHRRRGTHDGDAEGKRLNPLVVEKQVVVVAVVVVVALFCATCVCVFAHARAHLRAFLHACLWMCARVGVPGKFLFSQGLERKTNLVQQDGHQDQPPLGYVVLDPQSNTWTEPFSFSKVGRSHPRAKPHLQ